MLLALEAGYRVGRREQTDKGHPGTGAVEAALFGLLGLILAFTFSGAASRLDARRTMIVDEANAIGTAYLRIDLLPAAEQAPMRDLFRRYLDARLLVYEKLHDRGAAVAQLEEAAKLQTEIWTRAEAATRGNQAAALLLLPAINQMIDITTTRTMAMQTHVPTAIVALLFVLALMSAMVAGYAISERGRRTVLHMVLFALAISTTVFAVLDLEYPRFGIIRVTGADRALTDLRKSMRQ